MIKLGCNAMLPVAEDHRYPGKNDPRNWIDIAELVRMTRRLDLDIVDFQLFRGFRGKGPAYLRSIKGLCQQLGLPIGFFGRRRWFYRDRRRGRHPPTGARTAPAHRRSQGGH